MKQIEQIKMLEQMRDMLQQAIDNVDSEDSDTLPQQAGEVYGMLEELADMGKIEYPTTSAIPAAAENWVVACGGSEPNMLVNGKHYQLHYETNSKQRAYYCQEDDLFITEGMEWMLPEALQS